MSDIVTPFQWSIKLDDGQIYMVQAKTSEELGLAIEEIKAKFLDKDPQWIQRTGTPANYPNTSTVTQQQTAGNLGTCRKCGAPNLMSKNNKIYCSAKCWLK